MPSIEPPAWYFPIRQLLGAELLATGRAAEAAAVYRKDLEQYPANGWLLFGLQQAPEAQTAARQEEFATVWRGSDIVLTSSVSAMTATASAGPVSPDEPVDAQIANTMNAGPDVIGRDVTISFVRVIACSN